MIRKITSYNTKAGSVEYEKVTPKQKAQEILANGISVAISYWEDEAEGMTKREQALVQEQLDKIADRLVKKLGYKKSWHS